MHVELDTLVAIYVLTERMKLFIFTIFALSAQVLCQTTIDQYTASSGDSFRNMAVLSNGGLVVGSEEYLYLFDSSLNVTDTIETKTGNRLLLNIVVPELGSSILACQADLCKLHDSSNFSTTYDVEFTSGSDGILGGDRNLLGITDGSSVFVARPNDEDELVRATSKISKLSYTFNSSVLDFALTGAQEESSRFRDRLFLTSFIFEDFLYVVFYLAELRIARLCLDDSGSSSDSLTTYTEAVLDCDTVSTVTPTAATFFELNKEPLLIVTMESLVESSNKICLFNITEINQRMDQKLDDCAHGTGTRNLARDGSEVCPNLSPGQIDVSNN